MIEQDEKELARRVVRTYLERRAPDQLEDLDVAFDAVYRSVSNQLATLGDPEVESAEPRLPFGPEIVDASLILFATTIAVLYLRQSAATKAVLERIEMRFAEEPEAIRALIREELEKSRRSEASAPAPFAPAQTPAHTLLPADLEIRVTTRDDGGALVLDYVLHSPNGRFDLYHLRFPGGRLHRPDAWQEKIFRTLEKLHRGRGAGDASLSREEAAEDLAALGEDLSDELFPKELQRILREVREAETVLLVSDEPWIPWEIVKPYDSDTAAGGFLAGRFQLTRWSAGEATPAAHVDVARLAVVEAASPPDLEPLTKAGDESRFLLELAERHNVGKESLTDPTHAQVLAHLRRQDLGLIHLVGHSEHDAEDPEASGFHLHDGRLLTPRDLRRETRRRLRENRPLVFLNACQAGRQGWSLSRLGGWARRFVGAGCGAFVAPQWTVGDEDAYVFATAFYEALERGETFGRASVEARRALPEDSLGRLAYAIHAHPNARLRLGSTPLATPRSPGSPLKTVRNPRDALERFRRHSADAASDAESIRIEKEPGRPPVLLRDLYVTRSVESGIHRQLLDRRPGDSILVVGPAAVSGRLRKPCWSRPSRGSFVKEAANRRRSPAGRGEPSAVAGRSLERQLRSGSRGRRGPGRSSCQIASLRATSFGASERPGMK